MELRAPAAARLSREPGAGSVAGDAPERFRDPGAARVRRQGFVVLGLFLTLGGIFLLAVLFPVGSGALVHQTPVIAVGLFCLWIGGILMGRFSGSRVRSGSP
jgi:hypothetical protein